MMERKRALVLGAGGFIGHALVCRLKAEGYWVRGIDIGHPDFDPSPADEFQTFDLRKGNNIHLFRGFDEIYQLAADMGGAGYLFTGKNDAEVMRNSVLINANVLQNLKIVGFPKILFFSSSACVYPKRNQMDPLVPECGEGTVYPAEPDSEYGWEKLYAERMYLAHARNCNADIRIARFHTVYGPGDSFDGGREKAPAALCRKIAKASNDVEVWGDGKQTRTFLFIDDLIQGIRALMLCKTAVGPVNIGSEELIEINELAERIIKISGKYLVIKNVPGPVGVRGRRSSNDVITTLTGWKPEIPLEHGLAMTYGWIRKQLGVAAK